MNSWWLSGSYLRGRRSRSKIICLGLFAVVATAWPVGAQPACGSGDGGRVPAAQSFSRAFRLVRADTLPEDGPHAVLGVRAIAHTASGWVLVDSRSKRVTVRNGRWQVVRQLGPGGQGPGEYKSPADVRVTRDGSILVLDQEMIPVNVYGADGRVMRTMSPIPANTRRLELSA